jgi:hypothetical protein
MKTKLFNGLLLFSLFGVALGFFGILYEGLVYGPKLLDTSMERMLVWKGFFSVINPLVFYIPWVWLGSIILVILYFITPKLKTEIKNRLKWASILQLISLAITFYIVTQINFKLCFSDIGKYADVIPAKAFLFNILSVFRVIVTAIGLTFLFKGYIQTQKELTN